VTLAPAEEWHLVERAEGPKLVPNEVCSAPGCGRVSTDGHHIWRRSFTAGPVDWITFDGRALANKTWLCVEHHSWVNGGVGGHKAWISLVDATYWWNLVDTEGGWRCVGALEPQPAGCAGAIAWPETPSEEEETVIPDHICPDCGKVHKHRKKKPTSDIEPDGLEHLPARKRTRIQIQVPQDDQEDGADVIFTLLEDEGLQRALGTLGFNEKDRNYHTLSRGLVVLIQNMHTISFDKGES